jgi:hypothetical protein
MKKNTAPIKRTQLVKQGQIMAYFAWLKTSAQIKSLERTLTGILKKAETVNADDIPALMGELKFLNKEIEVERKKINEPINLIKSENQKIYQPMLDQVKTALEALHRICVAHVRAKEAAADKAQAELDRKAEELRAIQESNAADARAMGKQVALETPIIPIVAPTIAPVEYNKQDIPKRVDITVDDFRKFVLYVTISNNDELWDCIQFNGTSILQRICKRNPGKTDIPGIEAEYIPSLKAFTG